MVSRDGYSFNNSEAPHTRIFGTRAVSERESNREGHHVFETTTHSTAAVEVAPTSREEPYPRNSVPCPEPVFFQTSLYNATGERRSDRGSPCEANLSSFFLITEFLSTQSFECNYLCIYTSICFIEYLGRGICFYQGITFNLYICSNHDLGEAWIRSRVRSLGNVEPADLRMWCAVRILEGSFHDL